MSQKKTENRKNATIESKEHILQTIFDKMEMTYSIPKAHIPNILRNTSFKMDKGNAVNDAEMASLLSVAEKYKLNPFTGEITAFRNKKGVVMPVVTIDGWLKIMNSHDQHDGFTFNYPEETTENGDKVPHMITFQKGKKCYPWLEIVIYRKDRKYPIVIREHLDECYNGNKSYPSPWDTHTKRMLRHKTIIQGIRVAYGVSGVYDPDEAERVNQAIEEEGKISEEMEKPEDAKDIVSDEPTPIEEQPAENDDTIPEVNESSLIDDEQTNIFVQESEVEEDSDTDDDFDIF